jgi:peroxiredoxin
MKKIIGFTGLLALLILALAFTTNMNSGIGIGDKAPDFSLKNVDGKMVSLSDYPDAKGYIVIFSCNHCPYVIKYEDRMIELHNKFASKGYPVIAINPNDPEIQPQDSFEEMVKRSKEKGFSFPYLFDEGQKVFPQYGATRTPHVYLLDKGRTVRYIGAIDDSAEDASKVEVKYLENAIAAIEAGKDPDPATTRAIGCTIKVKKS